MPEPIILSWSGGKDSALALDRLRTSGEFEVVALLTTLTEGDERICMHGVRRELLQAQARSLQIPLDEVFIPPRASNEIYEAALDVRLESYRGQGVRSVAFGDLHLSDIRDYREAWLSCSGMTAVFPLWQQPTDALAEEFVDRGWRAVVCCCDGRVLDVNAAGRYYDRTFLESLPDGVDPCGENGEFHTFVCDGPGFATPISLERGAVSQSGPFLYYDLSLAAAASLCA